MAESKKSDQKERSASRRRKLLESLRDGAMSENWSTSSNPIKLRIGRLEAGWRDAITWLADDIRKMYANFATVSDAYDILDVNTAAIKSLCIDKGVFTEEEFQERKTAIMAYVDDERTRRQTELKELEEKKAAAKDDKEKPQPANEEQARSSDAVRIRDAVNASKDVSPVPACATFF